VRRFLRLTTADWPRLRRSRALLERCSIGALSTLVEMDDHGAGRLVVVASSIERHIIRKPENSEDPCNTPSGCYAPPRFAARRMGWQLRALRLGGRRSEEQKGGGIIVHRSTV
jgi:hypothetical protein